MSEKTPTPSLNRLVLVQLRNPTKLRFLLCAALLASWYLGFYGPASDQMAATSARADGEIKRADIARQIQGLREVAMPFNARIPAHSGQNELNQYILEHIRTTPIKIVDLRPAKVKDLGTLDAIGMRLQLEASYEDLDEFLLWVENNDRLLRIDSLKIDPNKDGVRLNVQVDLLSLAEKEKNAVTETSKNGKAGAKP